MEATAEALLGNPRAVLKIDCGEFQDSREIAKLIGSPPGYLGHRETRVIERLLVHPLSNLMATGRIQHHDRIRVTHNGESPSLTFFRETAPWETWKTNGVAAA